VAAGALLLAAGLLRPQRWLIPLLATTALVLGHGQWNLDRLERSWSGARGERERRIQRASDRLNQELTRARLLADSLARRGIALADLPREAGFDVAGRVLRGRGFEGGLMAFQADGAPYVWAGRFRVRPDPGGDSIDVRLTPYYAVLEVRRQDAAGRRAVGTVLLWANAVVPDGDRSVAARFRERTEVGLHLLPPEAAPDISDVFDYELPTTAGPRVLFSVQFVPPLQAEAIARARQTASTRITWLLLATVAIGVLLVPAGLGRLLLLLIPLDLVFRSPPGTSLGVRDWFDPRLFASPALGPVSSSAAALMLTGVALVLAARPLGKLPLPRAVALPLGGLLLGGVPFLLAVLGEGIQPPRGGVAVGTFLRWDLALFLFGAGLMACGLAILGKVAVRGTRGPGWAATLILSLGLAALGFVWWDPLQGWPVGYFALWLLPVLPLLVGPGPRTKPIGIAILAGSLAAVLAWGAENREKVRAAQADVAELADRGPTRLDRDLEALGQTLARSTPPRSMSDLYGLWRTSPLWDSGLPVSLALWGADGVVALALRLDELDLPDSVIAEAVRGLGDDSAVAVRRLDREPAPHYLVLVRYGEGQVLTLAVGPASGLIAPSRLGRLLGARAPGRPLYRLALAPTPSESIPAAVHWRREGSRVLGQYTLPIAGTSRALFGTVEIGTPASLAVRGALLLLIDGMVLALLWATAGVLTGETPRRPSWIPRFRSYEARIGMTLSVFFLAPTVGFAAWGIGRLRGEVRASRDRGIEQTLRDVLSPRATLPGDSVHLANELGVLSERTDGDFVAFRDGLRIAGTRGGLLETLGLVDPVMDPEAFHRLVIDGAAVTTGPGPSRAIDVRIGYRALRLADFGAGVLAMPQTGFDPVLEERQRDLAMLFLLLTVLGIGASLLAANAAARALSRPVAELQRAALAFGKGQDLTLPAEPPAPEFAPVYAAFEKMTADVRRSREAQEQVARIVAWGEMASQVAHEIKNPLTPMRLGVQHLRRVHEDGRTPLGPVLESTTARILAEIDRLDRIARSFSRFGMPASERGPLEAVKLPAVVRDVAELYRLGPEGAEIVVETDHPEPAAARADEVKEALVNLLENSRNALARTIRVRIRGTTVSVEDDGRGIPADLLPRIFEPRFSTSTSGSGLGLAIVKRLVEGWGGTIAVQSVEGQGTEVRLELRPADRAGPGPASSPGTPSTEPLQ
jgi:signal transduction histidine kinase